MPHFLGTVKDYSYRQAGRSASAGAWRPELCL
jgi:hypothetical protein